MTHSTRPPLKGHQGSSPFRPLKFKPTNRDSLHSRLFTRRATRAVVGADCEKADRAKVRASSSRQPRPFVRVRLHRSRDGSPLERLRERDGSGGAISVQGSLPQSLDHAGEPAGVVVRFEPCRVRFWLQLVQLLYEALECDRCHRGPSVTCPCSSWWTLSSSGYG